MLEINIKRYLKITHIFSSAMWYLPREIPRAVLTVCTFAHLHTLLLPHVVPLCKWGKYTPYSWGDPAPVPSHSLVNQERAVFPLTLPLLNQRPLSKADIVSITLQQPLTFQEIVIIIPSTPWCIKATVQIPFINFPNHLEWWMEQRSLFYSHGTEVQRCSVTFPK